MKSNDDPGTKKDQEAQKKLQELKTEYNTLNEQRIATDRDKKNLETQLKDLKDKAQREYGTSDVEELRRLLEERRRENERMVNDYETHINNIKFELEKIEKPGAAE